MGLFKYSIIKCSGWAETKIGSFMASSPCLKSKLGLVFLFFFLALIRRWGAEEWGIGFNLILAEIAGILSYLLVIGMFGSFKAAMAVGLLCGLAGGYGIGLFSGSSDDSGGGDGGY